MNLAVRPQALRGERARRVETELLDLAALEARPACWDRLAAEAAYPNPLRVGFATFTEGEGLRQAVDAFLALEAAGWKGRRGTALAARDPGAPLTRALFSGPGACASSRADVLMLAGRPIAVSLSLLCGGTCFLLKTSYEEAFRGLAPGILLEDAILRTFLDEGFAEKLDSASLPGSVLEGLFADRERMADVAIATGPAISPRALAALVRQERIRQAALARAKSWY